MKRRVVTNWRKRNVSLEKAILAFPATGKETKERERERNMGGEICGGVRGSER